MRPDAANATGSQGRAAPTVPEMAEVSRKWGGDKDCGEDSSQCPLGDSGRPFVQSWRDNCSAIGAHPGSDNPPLSDHRT